MTQAAVQHSIEDSEVADLIRSERERQWTTLRLIASENQVSRGVLAALGSEFVNKSSEGYPGQRYHEGQEYADAVEVLAAKRAQRLFGVEHANVQPYSGSSANLAVLSALMAPGDTLMAMQLTAGGHLTHGSPASLSGQLYRVAAFGVRRDTERIDLDEVRTIARRRRPRVIVCGGTSLPRQVEFEAFGEIAKEVNAFCIADISHVAGLIVGGVHPSPAGFVDIVTTTTHKTLRGPRGAIVMCRPEHARQVDRAIFPRFQGAAHMNSIAAIAVALHEAGQPAFREYARRVVDNAQRLAEELEARGLRLVTGGTDTHMILLDVGKVDLTGQEAAVALAQARIETNANPIPFDNPRKDQWTGVRLGTAAMSSRGAMPNDMPLFAEWIVRAIGAARSRDGCETHKVSREIVDYLWRLPRDV